MDNDHTTKRIGRAMAQIVRQSLMRQRDDRAGPPTPVPAELSTAGLFASALPRTVQSAGLDEPPRSFVQTPPPVHVPQGAAASFQNLAEPPRTQGPTHPSTMSPPAPSPGTLPHQPHAPSTPLLTPEDVPRPQEQYRFLSEPPMHPRPDMRGSGFSARDPYGRDDYANAMLADHRQFDPVRDDVIQQQVHQSITDRDYRKAQLQFNYSIAVDNASDYRNLQDIVSGLERGRNTITDVNY